MRQLFLSALLIGSCMPGISLAQNDPLHRSYEQRRSAAGTVTDRVTLADGKPAE